ncbi:hypothetical protein GCM10010435_91470 [Winogradskya consettensis]|uniref:N-acetyltransferase domain-containing protein n=1 Tax=Winogradskya consettensis TaxID=113560 RepID=A0A919SJW5_9ACTN|nr:GNAT family N-acetyltransferase [Actinoplanes consettensis]GIM73396.1 hypothetical protein Aco04nite_35040 [Actinoplanes consettensis]
MTIEIRTVDGLAELAELDVVLGGIWQDGPAPLLGVEVLRALAKAGNYIAAAYDDGALIGGCVGFFGPPAERELHSHVAGVTRAVAGRGVGYALKQHQREWALEHGAAAITWTYDPLVARNAHFNLVKLGGEPVEYLTDFYGPMHDVINGDDPSDRLLVRWDLTGQAKAPPVGEDVVVAVPADIEALRTRDPAAARRWRLEVREVLGGPMASGARVVGFDRARGYVLRWPA